ncbi:minor capsid protein [Aneurinibacillus thermoaerophilus]|uniref:Minor capsid protein n=1 Tax=Aneurinibacillus thermoaerophilus TaxID=143495 RepID=A0ABX8Y7X7_ANETH|nr:minor capsid protein [Aneurinibacillus thermoaerophilus]QYY41470.1 minor capsid protein [Aneurinibacillus thermoaerophilus]
MSREEQYQIDLEKRIAKYATHLKKLFGSVTNSIIKEVAMLYAKHAETNEEYPSFLYSAIQLEQIMQMIQKILFDLGAQEEAQLRAVWGEEYKRSLYHHLYFIEEDFGVSVNVPMLNGPMILAAVEHKWEGRHFSKRIRLRTDLLAAAIEDVITRASVQGWGVTRTSKEIMIRTTESWSNAVRLARTELNRAAAQGQSLAYQANSDIIEAKEFCATLDTKTSKVCRKVDGKKFPLDYDTPANPGKEGERIPNHPNCRSYWRPVMKSKVLESLERERAYKLWKERGYTKARTFEQWAEEKGIAA